ncbi:MAG: agmatine deiminase family protein [Rhizobiales bacterium]|nr:agmatine deiminase family protein [Hyphomicrobiales bacterium]
MMRRTLLKGGLAGLWGLGAGGAAAAPSMAGFRAPEETHRHTRTFMQWPANRTVHDDADFLDDLQGAVARVANAISDFEPVVMLMDKAQERGARAKLARAVEIWDIPTDDLWCRDCGPLFVVDGKGGLAVSRIRFNGWGGKQTHKNDGQIAARVAKRLGVPVFEQPLVGESGGVESDGEGTLIAHESCWVNPNRNRESKAVVTERLLAALGARKMIWAPGVKGEDITDYHIDALARFVRPGAVVIQMPEKIDPTDPWSKSAFETYDILAAATDADGRKLKLETLPEPTRPRVKADDFVASYVNYYVCNGAVIAAQFGDRDADAQARATLARLYPGREVLTLDIDAIGEVGGGVHCATQQQPTA